MRSGETHCKQELAEEVRRDPLQTIAGRGGPARPTANKSWQRRSGENEEKDKEKAKEEKEERSSHKI